MTATVCRLSKPVRSFVQAVGIPVACGYSFTGTSPMPTKEMPVATDNLLPDSTGAYSCVVEVA